MRTKATIFLFLLLLVSYGYAQNTGKLPDKEKSHVFYATGNLVTAQSHKESKVLSAIAKEMGKDANSTLLLLGNNANSKLFLEKGGANKIGYLDLLKPFSDRVVFIPGHRDWSNGLDALKSQEKYLRDIFDDKNVFQPKNGCPLKKIKINEDIDLLVIDSQWALSNWDTVPNINDGCDIKTKVDFYVEIEHEVVKSQGKTVLVAVYHPLNSYGKYGAALSLGLNSQNINNKYYKEFSDRLLTIAQQNKNLVFVSGHEQNMQFILDKNVPIIISGAAGTIKNAKNGRKSVCSFNENGFSKIVEYTDGSMWMAFYGVSDNFTVPLFSAEIVGPHEVKTVPDFNEKNTPQTVSRSIFQPEELKRSGFYRMLWGEHFRDDYTTPIKMETALLDTLYGGLSVVRKGGGHQTNSLRLEDKNGSQYVMRSTRKSALRFIQYFIFKTQYLGPDVENTFMVKLLQDYWTTENPYGALTVGDLADAINVYHANTKLYYIPKQKALGIYNDDYGDKSYLIEERVADGHEDVASFGNAKQIISTADMLDELRKKEHGAVNKSRYIRSRLFDNVLGDWDRHADQWRWGVKKNSSGEEIYQPIPRDRDQVYSDFDGAILGLVRILNPMLRFMQHYDETYNSVRWFNDAGDDIDLAVLVDHNREDWLKEAKYIKENLTDEAIEKAFSKFPKEIDQSKVERTKKALRGRVENLDKLAVELYEYIRSTVLITGSDKKDHFVITRKPGGITNVSISKGKNGDKYWNVDYDRSETKELWIYGLDGEDTFEVNGDGNHMIKVKIIGGRNNDTYRINTKNKVRIFDQRSQPNTFETSANKVLTDDYDLNTYHYMKNRRDLPTALPIITSNPDLGLLIGAVYNYTKNSLRRNPFTANHNLSVAYITETSGVVASYQGEFANLFNKVNLGIDLGYSSPNYTINFFGFGNETTNMDDDMGFDFNRVRLQTLRFSPSLIFRGYQGSKVKLSVSYENIEAQRTPGRFIETANVNPNVFQAQNFYGAEFSYGYENFDNAKLPKGGIGFNLTAGYKANFEEDRSFGYIIPELRFTTKLDNRGILVYATKFKAQFNLSDEFEFYQAATLGDGNGRGGGLRGFRHERFSGKKSYYQNSDLRLSLGRIKNSIFPISFGAYGAFDYGRVWVEDDNSGKWHNTPGAGLYFNLAGFTTANVGYFDSDDGGRLNILLSLAF
ncbi:phosphoesterase [Flagellimonas sp. CMM7]|uniref:phosphoesterase n=1 Tax=Flagellimonas sp. CMM7 TaxID=2654676 RepID=UPI001969D8CA|nr:phosphoesterase [Flagellimonas sp. CMM7]UII80332.1 phosphoesterase [Flagellimonas sp. CMM7]